MSVTFVRVDGTGPVVEFLLGRLTEQLVAGKRVLWLVPGGSAVSIVAAVCQRLNNSPVHNLTLSLTDERYGPVGHADSNWQQLLETGFGLEGATVKPVLHNLPIDKERQQFDDWLGEQLSGCDYRLGFFGMGPDGHTAGILPESLAVDAPGWAVAYDGGQFQRISITGRAIATLDEAALYAVGAEKQSMIEALAQDLPVSRQPAQYLKLVNKLTVFNDRKGDNL